MNKNIIILLFFAMIGFHYESICAQQNEQVPLHPVATGDGTLSSEIIGTLDSPQRSPIYILSFTPAGSWEISDYIYDDNRNIIVGYQQI